MAEVAQKVNIMGSEWYIYERPEKDDPRLEGCDGYCDWTTKSIVIERDMQGNLENMEEYIRKVKRHEIVHAFLVECGLAECSGRTDSWARNEAMVDWIARIGPKLYGVWETAGAL